jgi:FKBP-type peptidyl-prolyl cis-trans isomerase (trigger factor)
MGTSYINLKKTKEKDGEIAFEAELSAEATAEAEKEVLAEAGADFAAPGFRKGKVPEAMVRERMNPVELLEEVAHKALPDAVREIIEEEKLSILGRPEVAVTKLAPGNPVVFTVRFSLIPEIKLPDYKSIAQKIVKEAKPVTVAQEEVNEAVKHLQEMFRGADGKKDAALPELTDELVRQSGPYKDIPEFMEELKRSLAEGKSREEKEKRREEMVQAIVAKTKIKIPALLVSQEFEAFLENRDEELQKAGISIEDYLKQVKKTEEEMEKEERAAIEKQIAASLVMGAMRKEEKIAADEKEIAANIAALKRRYPDRTDAELWEPAEAIAIQKRLFDILESTEKAQPKKE